MEDAKSFVENSGKVDKWDRLKLAAAMQGIKEQGELQAFGEHDVRERICYVFPQAVFLKPLTQAPEQRVSLRLTSERFGSKNELAELFYNPGIISSGGSFKFNRDKQPCRVKHCP
jgi:hypothetical protein